MIKKALAWLIVALNVVFMSTAQANVAEDEATFQAIFRAWTQAFNEQRFPEVCKLFSRSLIADYQGAQTKNYSSMGNGFKKIFEEREVVYHNDLKLHQIYRSNDLATVRITWYLNICKEGVHLSSMQEEGLDVFQKQDKRN